MNLDRQEGAKYILPIVNSNKKKLAVIPCTEEESASVEWEQTNKEREMD